MHRCIHPVAAAALTTLLLAGCGGGTPPAAVPTAATPTAAVAQPAGVAQPAATTSSAAPPPPTAPTPASAGQSRGPASSGGSTQVRSAAMPANPAPYDPARRARIGEAVRLPSGVVVQAHGVQSRDRDAATEWLLVDITIGNGAKEEETVSSILSFDVFTSDCQEHGLKLEDVVMLATASASGTIPDTFDETLQPGEAKRGTAMAVVPREAKGLALRYLSQAGMLGELATLAGQTADPPVFVALGVRGDFSPPGTANPAIPCPQGTGAGSSRKP